MPGGDKKPTNERDAVRSDNETKRFQKCGKNATAERAFSEEQQHMFVNQHSSQRDYHSGRRCRWQRHGGPNLSRVELIQDLTQSTARSTPYHHRIAARVERTMTI